MSISFPAIVDEWVALGSLAVSLRNTAFCHQRVESIAKPVAGVKGIFQEPAPILLNTVRWEQEFRSHWGAPFCVASSLADELARFASIVWSCCCGMRSRY